MKLLIFLEKDSKGKKVLAHVCCMFLF